MNLTKLKEEHKLNYTIDFNTLSNSAKFLIQGGNGLKVGEKIHIPKQPIGMGTFIVNNVETDATPCVLATVTSVNGVERSMKLSLSQLNRRSYGTDAKRVVSGDILAKDFPNVNVHEAFDLIIRKDENSAELTNELKLVVKKSENHMFSVYENRKPKLNDDGTLETEMRLQMIFGLDK